MTEKKSLKMSLTKPLWQEPDYINYQEGVYWLKFFPQNQLVAMTNASLRGGRFMESFLDGIWYAGVDVELTMHRGKPYEVIYEYKGGEKCQVNPPFFLLGMAFGLGQWEDVQKQLIDYPMHIRMGVFVNTAFWHINNEFEGKITLRNRNSA